MDDSAFNALGLVKKVGLSVKCESTAQRKAKKSNAYFHFFVFEKTKILRILKISDFFSKISKFSIGSPIQNFKIFEFSKSQNFRSFLIFFGNKKKKICVWFFRLALRGWLAFHAQTDLFDEPKCVEHGISPTFQRAAPRLQTRKPRETRTDKLRSVKLILTHSL